MIQFLPTKSKVGIITPTEKKINFIVSRSFPVCKKNPRLARRGPVFNHNMINQYKINDIIILSVSFAMQLYSLERYMARFKI
jgi:hypothetical protein